MQSISNSQQPSFTSAKGVQPRPIAARNIALPQPMGHDSIRFGQSEQAAHSENPDQEVNLPPQKGGMKGAFQQIGNDLKRPGWWAKQMAIATAITLATCWLPGSQLATIPAWMAISVVHSGYKGHQNNPEFLKAIDEWQAQQDANRPQRAFGPKLVGATKGAFQGAWHELKDNFKRDLLMGGAVTLATCWLPGTQLIIIPAFMCISAAMGAMRGASSGWKGGSVST